jgi:hypothetical protein
MSRTMKLVGVAVVVAVVAAAVIFAVRTRPGSLTIATSPGGGSGSPLAGLSGTLQGTQHADHSACFWVDAGRGKVFLSWPAGWSAERNPLRVLDEHGIVMATTGQAVDLGGSNVTGAVAHCPAAQPSRFSVGTVSVSRP